VGVSIGGGLNTIGGTAPGARNVISGNRVGVLPGLNGNLVQGNFIGTDVTGTAALGNSSDGVTFGSVSNSNTIGGTAAGACNVISGNQLNGVRIAGARTNGNVVQGNFIGTQMDGTSPLGNTGHGLLITVFTSMNTIGGTAMGAGNTIVFNGGDGVFVDSTAGTNNAILSNSIFSNTGLGIDLGADGVTPNDPGDGDTGANNLQNFPVLTSASSSVGGTTIAGTLNSTPNTTFRLEFYSNAAGDPSGFGEGETFIGSTMVTTDGSGNNSFTVTFPITVPAGHVITATATDPGNNTSEFSGVLK
jgi:titin